MSQYTEAPCKGYPAGGAIAKNLRVKLLSTGKLAVAGISDKDIGVTENAAFAEDDDVTVRLRTAPGTHKVTVSEAVDAGAELYTAASGKVSDTYASGSYPYGVALEAATANADVIEVLRNSHGDTSKT